MSDLSENNMTLDDILATATHEVFLAVDDMPAYQRERVASIIVDLVRLCYNKGREDEKYYTGNWIESPSKPKRG